MLTTATTQQRIPAMLQTQAMPLILQTKLQTKQKTAAKTAAKTPQKIPATLLMNQTATKVDAPRGHRPLYIIPDRKAGGLL